MWLATEIDRGSIPAYAGEPFMRRSLSASAGVYPRVRGGAHGRWWIELCASGLSPRTRGSL